MQRWKECPSPAATAPLSQALSCPQGDSSLGIGQSLPQSPFKDADSQKSRAWDGEVRSGVGLRAWAGVRGEGGRLAQGQMPRAS